MKLHIFILFIAIFILSGCFGGDNKAKIDKIENQVIVGTEKVSEKGIGKSGDSGTIETNNGFSN
ncbi:MAG: hypothetical protein Q8K30_00345 [Candidatus Gracilibacteria bacterium]|nr:hypothetical protein [Candidatus Gracilibacteria bacterium]